MTNTPQFSHGDRVIRKGETNRKRYGSIDGEFSRYTPPGKVYVYWHDTFRMSCIFVDNLMLRSEWLKQHQPQTTEIRDYWTGGKA